MKVKFNYKNILWDFDGVILDSMQIRTDGFRDVLKDFQREKVDLLIDYHLSNGGLSRYIKFRYFYENILNTSISKHELLQLTDKFTEIMKQKLTNKSNIIDDSVNFIKRNHKEFNFHVVSASDGTELKFLVKKLGLFSYFKSVEGSPTLKEDLIKNCLEKNSYDKNETILIGDSINDYHASKSNEIAFFGYNNTDLIKTGVGYIYHFE